MAKEELWIKRKMQRKRIEEEKLLIRRGQRNGECRKGKEREKNKK